MNNLKAMALIPMIADNPTIRGNISGTWGTRLVIAGTLAVVLFVSKL